MIVYALYHVPTKEYMPAKMWRHSPAGWSWWEPTNVGGYGGETKCPRLFDSLHAAKKAKEAWLRGPQKKKIVLSSYSIQQGSEPATGKFPPRHADELAIVTIKLTHTEVIR